MNGEDGYFLSKSWKPLVFTLTEEGRASLNRTFLLQNLLYCFERAKFFCALPATLLQLKATHTHSYFVHFLPHFYNSKPPTHIHILCTSCHTSTTQSHPHTFIFSFCSFFFKYIRWMCLCTQEQMCVSYRMICCGKVPVYCRYCICKV